MKLDAVVREQCRLMAAMIDLRVLTILRPDGGRLYALWPSDGFAREIDSPPLALSWESLHCLLWRMLHGEH